MFMYPLKPGVVFNFEVTGPIAPTTKWTFDEFYSPEDRKGPLKDYFRKQLCLIMVNKAIAAGRIDQAGVWEATVIRKRSAVSIYVRHVGANVKLI